MKKLLFRGSKKEVASDPVDEVRNWYSERFETVVVQRNILLLLILFILVAITVCIFTVYQVTLSKTVEPFVVEIERKTGIVKTVDPNIDNAFGGNEALARYFILKYIQARESYDPNRYKENYFTLVRLFSDQDTYGRFRGFIRSSSDSPLNKFTEKDRVHARVDTIVFRKEANTAEVHFSQIQNDRTDSAIRKIVVLKYRYARMEVKDEDIAINPLGFQVTEYSVNIGHTPNVKVGRQR